MNIKFLIFYLSHFHDVFLKSTFHVNRPKNIQSALPTGISQTMTAWDRDSFPLSTTNFFDVKIKGIYQHCTHHLIHYLVLK